MPHACKIKRKEHMYSYQLRWMKKRRDDWLDDNGPCVKGGSDYRLEIDHISYEDKSRNTRDIWSRKKVDRDAELKKCQVLCAECHRDKTTAENKIRVHRKFNCYCAECRAKKKG